MRPLTPGEVDLARSLFGDAIDYERVRILDSPARRVAVTVGSRIFFPAATSADFSREGLSLRAWFIHEMTHVLQFQRGMLRTLWSWLKTAARGGYARGRGYGYRLPLQDWGGYNLEQQASMVEHAYVLREQGACAAAPEGVTLNAYERCVPYLNPPPLGKISAD